jgi:serine/threonine-protein kinase Chk2
MNKTAPEVRISSIGRAYNNSMDMWSMGVIMYVSLCGQFPFEDDEDIESQLNEFKYMFPNEIWSDISPGSK